MNWWWRAGSGSWKEEKSHSSDKRKPNLWNTYSLWQLTSVFGCVSQPCNHTFLQSSPDAKGEEGSIACCGGVSRGSEVEERRPEGVNHIEFWGLRSHTRWAYKFMCTRSLDIGQCADQNWLGRCSVSALWPKCRLAQHWPEESGSCSHSPTSG